MFRTYYELGRSVNLIAEFLREKGYNAQAIPAISSNLNFAVVARDVGLGEFGKHGQPYVGSAIGEQGSIWGRMRGGGNRTPSHTAILENQFTEGMLKSSFQE